MSRKRGTRIIASAFAAAAILSLVGCSGSGGSSSDRAETWTRIGPVELDGMLRDRDIFLVNVHVPYEGEIPGTDAFIPYDQMASHLDELPADPSKLVLYCRSGNMSTDAARTLVASGITGFSELAGGYNAWSAQGLPFLVATPTG